METNQEENYTVAKKKVWAIYSLITASIVIFPVTVVARDVEEQLFLGGFFGAAFYIFRPNSTSIQAAVKKWFNVEPPPSDEPPTQH